MNKVPNKQKAQTSSRNAHGCDDCRTGIAWKRVGLFQTRRKGANVQTG